MKWEGYEALGNYSRQRKKEYNEISEERKKQLARLARAVRHDLDLECSADLIFI